MNLWEWVHLLSTTSKELYQFVEYSLNYFYLEFKAKKLKRNRKIK